MGTHCHFEPLLGLPPLLAFLNEGAPFHFLEEYLSYCSTVWAV